MDTEGIRHITGEDIIFFKRLNRVCRLIASSALNPDGSISAFVEPTLVSEGSTEAAVHANNNTISVTGEYFGLHTFQGQGAGKDPTAFAVELGLRDILDGVTQRLDPIPEGYADVDNGQVCHRYYLRTAAPLTMCGEALGPCGSATAYLTQPMSVRAMHDLATELRKADPSLFFAGINE